MDIRALLAAALVCAGLGAASASAQTAPAELPPEGFSGTQFVDSRGCAYTRAAVDGQVAWIPRLTRDRAAVCGLTPTFAADARAAEASPPRRADVAAPPRSARTAAARRSVAARAKRLDPARLRVPRGYRPVWTDDRLNPRRGPRSAEGDAQMARIWTDTVPRKLVPPEARPAPRYLRVGVFCGATDLRPTIGRIQRLGLPVSRARAEGACGPVTFLYAGPFTHPDDVERAEARLATAGYSNLTPRK